MGNLHGWANIDSNLLQYLVLNTALKTISSFFLLQQQNPCSLDKVWGRKGNPIPKWRGIFPILLVSVPHGHIQLKVSLLRNDTIPLFPILFKCELNLNMKVKGKKLIDSPVLVQKKLLFSVIHVTPCYSQYHSQTLQ